MPYTRFWVLIFLLGLSVPCFANEVLVVGDSLSCGPFGQRLVQDLTARGHSVDVYCTVSSTPRHWLQGKNPSQQICMTFSSSTPAAVPCDNRGKVPLFANLLARKAYQNVLVALGTNSLLDPTPDADYDKMAALVAGTHLPCQWIGPPHLRFDQARGFSVQRLMLMEGHLQSFYPGLHTAVAPACAVLDSRAATAPGTPGNDTLDGVHRTVDAGNYWADLVAPQLLK